MGDEAGYLVLEARFVAGTYGGVEWPPSPFRLLQAIVAGCRSTVGPGTDWLERQPAPAILATREPPAALFRRSIPNNADPGKPDARLSMREIRYRRVDEPVRYCYALAGADDERDARHVIATAERVHTFGVGEDMCVLHGLIVDGLPEGRAPIELWLPALPGQRVRSDADIGLRVPVAGSLDSLRARHAAFQRRLNAGEDGFARPVTPAGLHHVVNYRNSADRSRIAFALVRLVRVGAVRELRSFHRGDAVVVAAMLRHGIMRLTDTAAPELRGFAAGHAPASALSKRMSWVPLPSVGHPHSDGLIRRALFISRAEDLAELGAVIERLPADGVPLVDEETGECVAIAALADPDEEPVLRAYLAPARRWVSITPVVLPGDFGAGNLRVMTRLLRKALRESDIDPGLLERAEFSKVPFARQAVQMQDVRLKDWKATHLILYHVRVTFRAPIAGPIVLGRGRHFGLGLFAGVDKSLLERGPVAHPDAVSKS